METREKSPSPNWADLLVLARFSNKLVSRDSSSGRVGDAEWLPKSATPLHSRILAPPHSRPSLRYAAALPSPPTASSWSRTCLSEGRARARPRPVARWCHLGRERGCACSGPKVEGHQGAMAATASPGAGRMDGKPRTSPKSVKFLFGGLAG